ncbi:serine hydrolase domain-containing protein [Amycolatopsis suaedae]|uniref:Class A beta-lactamase-related serine hydrolase n=1 Tax=Amycolatopsis suaedae TaxID=2510978 RepID=A0A4Q7J5N3_9PSEU|nr:serine hydrolase domain-containing protein [Amycolatopsis suaedae]RZQ62427.1 class A beta-lactamase-related serine hydrolase [Amycolatopsis suaedae]
MNALHERLTEAVGSGAFPGVVALVAVKGEPHVEVLGTLHAGGGEPMRRDTIFRMASATKPVTATAVLRLVEDGRLRLDDPVRRWLPELAGRRVLRGIDAELDDTVPARREVTVRDLLTFTWGFGMVIAPPGTYPIQRAMAELGIGSDGTSPAALDPDEWLRRLGSLPLMCQPGQRWLYNTGSDVLGVLVARVTGGTFGDFLAERVFGPLGMVDTGFHVPAGKIGRLPTSYAHDPDTGELVVWDPAAGGKYSSPPPFQVGGDGLVSTVDDYHVFTQMLLNGGRRGAVRILSEESVRQMTTDQLTPEQKEEKDRFPELFGDHGGFGFGLGVRTIRRGAASVGQFGWDGGLGTSVQVDPARQLSGVLLTQVAQDTADTPGLIRDFWELAYAALDD